MTSPIVTDGATTGLRPASGVNHHPHAARVAVRAFISQCLGALMAMLTSVTLLGSALPAQAQPPAGSSQPTIVTGFNGFETPDAPRQTPEGLSCRLPTVWVSERINQPYPRTPIAVDERAVYTGADNLYALDKKTGAVLWHYDFPNANFDMALARYGVNGLAVDANTVYFGGYAGTLVAVNKRNGQLRWKMDDIHPSEQIAMTGNLLFATNGGQTYALDKATGKVQWEKFYGPSFTLANNTLYMAGTTDIYAVNPKNGEQQWINHTKAVGNKDAGYFDIVHSLPYVYNNQVMAYSLRNVMYGFDAKTGTLLWQFDKHLDGRTRALMGRGDTVLFYSETGNLTLFNLKTLQTEWWYHGPGDSLRPPVYYKGLILLSNEKNALIALDYATGKEVFRHELDEDLRAVRAMVVQGDMLYLNSIDGKVHALRLECPQLKGREGFR